MTTKALRWAPEMTDTTGGQTEGNGRDLGSVSPTQVCQPRQFQAWAQPNKHSTHQIGLRAASSRPLMLKLLSFSKLTQL